MSRDEASLAFRISTCFESSRPVPVNWLRLESQDGCRRRDGIGY